MCLFYCTLHEINARLILRLEEFNVFWVSIFVVGTIFGGKIMIENTTFSWKSVIKGSCTAKEFRVILEKEKLDGKVFFKRWLDRILFGGYLQSLSINYVGMSKDMEKRLPKLYYVLKNEKFLWPGFYCNRLQSRTFALQYLGQKSSKLSQKPLVRKLIWLWQYFWSATFIWP